VYSTSICILILGIKGKQHIVIRQNVFHPAHIVGHSPYPLCVSAHLGFLISSLLMAFKWEVLFLLPYGGARLLYLLLL
jgi:hypothetical protein